MSASMVGYILVGPQYPRGLDTFGDRDMAALRALVDFVADRVSAFEGGIIKDSDLPDYLYEVSDQAEMEDSFEGLVPDLFLQESSPSDQDILDEVRNVMELWEDAKGAPDALIREEEGGAVIVAAGDMSWGDEPMGGGYEALRDLTRHPFSSFLGIS